MAELRRYQAEDYKFFGPLKRAMILYEMRLGKTPLAVTYATGGCEVILVICPKNALYTWRDCILGLNGWDKWDPRPCEVRICHGSASDRIFEYARKRTGTTWYVTTYGSFIRDQEDILKYVFPPHLVILDEAKRIRNKKSVGFKAVEQLCRPSSVRVLFLEGTPTNKGPKDFWTMFNIIDKKRFGSYHTYIEHFYETVQGNFGGTELVQPRNLDQFHRLLGQYSRIRYRAEVRPEMPTVQRELVPIDMDSEQQKLYRSLDLNSFVWTDRENLVVAPTSLELSIRLRQLLICPKLLDANLGLGSAWDAFTETLEDTDDPKERCCVVYSPFKTQFEHWQADLNRRGYKDVFQLHGGISPRQQEDAIKAFQKSQGIILCTIRYAEAFSLTPATASYFIGQEWNPNTNRQAEDRLVPQEGTNPITANYYAYQGTMEFDIVRHLDNQQRIIDKTMGRKT